MALILIRHPETIYNTAGIFADDQDVPYTAVGEEQFEQLMTLDTAGYQIISSPQKRCLDVADGLALQSQQSVTIDSRLRELEFGDFSGLTYRQIGERYPDLIDDWMTHPWTFHYPGGESYPDLVNRVFSLLHEITTDTVICSHQAVCFVISQLYHDSEPMKTGEWRKYETNPNPRP